MQRLIPLDSCVNKGIITVKSYLATHVCQLVKAIPSSAREQRRLAHSHNEEVDSSLGMGDKPGANTPTTTVHNAHCNMALTPRSPFRHTFSDGPRFSR